MDRHILKSLGIELQRGLGEGEGWGAVNSSGGSNPQVWGFKIVRIQDYHFPIAKKP